MVLADAVDHRPSRLSAQPRSEGHRRLTRLIAPLCGERAEAIADELIADFGSLPVLLRSNRSALSQRLRDNPALVDLLVAIRPLVHQLLLTEMLTGPVLPDSRAALDYLFVSLAHETAEQVHVLFLDAKNRVLAQERVARGSVTKVDLFPREIVRRALDLGATGLILAHNHPSGDPTPSRSDFSATRALADAARLFDIILHDHIIVGRAGWRSLRGEGYL
jgi:DNA repair protein RadC